MPITLPPISRRTFLVASLAAALAPKSLFAADVPVDPHRFALLSDIHVHGDRAFAKESTNPFDNLAQAVREILAAPTRPAAVLVNGDLAAHQGNPEDYATLLDALAPLRQAGLTVHLALGNHDDRDNFWRAIPQNGARQKDVDDRQVCLIESPRANLFMLDSLDVVAKTPGVLGPRQLAWLAKALDARPDKPAIVFVHHDPIAPDATKKTGLIDTKALLDLLAPRKQVKAHVYGHTHDWRYVPPTDPTGLHAVNLPPTAWVFQQGKVRGWVDLTLVEQGGAFKLHGLDPKHEQHGQKFDLTWR
jgi:3',5'-cyclic AMP phosphodiesterase CpdA